MGAGKGEAGRGGQGRGGAAGRAQRAGAAAGRAQRTGCDEARARARLVLRPLHPLRPIVGARELRHDVLLWQPDARARGEVARLARLLGGSGGVRRGDGGLRLRRPRAPGARGLGALPHRCGGRTPIDAVGVRDGRPCRAGAARRDRRGGGAARAARLQAAGPREHGVGVRDGRPRRAGAARRDRRGGEGGAGCASSTPQNLANTAWAYATAGHAAPALLDAIAEEAARRGLREFNEQDLANTAGRTLRPTAPRRRSLAATPLRSAARRSAGSAPDALCQLHQWQLWQEERGAAWPPLPPELAQRCRDAFCQEEGAPSRLQRDVAASLRALGLAPREEERTPQGYSLDAVVSHGGREVAVEVDGPSHFCGRTPTGATALKRRQLRAAGWALLPVPYWEWNALGSEAAKQAYLRAALEGLGQEAAAVVARGAAVGAPLPSEAELMAMKMPELRAFVKAHFGDDGAVSLTLGGEQRRAKANVVRDVLAALPESARVTDSA